MRWLLALLVLTACTEPPVPVSNSLPEHCETKARLPMPPNIHNRTIDRIIAFARTAARTANAAINERDTCALDYARLRAACSTKAGCIIPPRPRP